MDFLITWLVEQKTNQWNRMNVVLMKSKISDCGSWVDNGVKRIIVQINKKLSFLLNLFNKKKQTIVKQE